MKTINVTRLDSHDEATGTIVVEAICGVSDPIYAEQKYGCRIYFMCGNTWEVKETRLEVLALMVGMK